MKATKFEAGQLWSLVARLGPHPLRATRFSEVGTTERGRYRERASGATAQVKSARPV